MADVPLDRPPQTIVERRGGPPAEINGRPIDLRGEDLFLFSIRQRAKTWWHRGVHQPGYPLDHFA